MGGTISTVYVANAYPADVWVRVDTERVKESTFTSKHDMGGGGSISAAGPLDVGKLGADVRKERTKESSTDYHLMKMGGFTKLASGKVTPYSPPHDHKDKDKRRAYVTIKTIDGNCDEEIIADSHPCKESTSLIITKEGCITQARSNLGKQGCKWIDIDEEEHLRSSCRRCLKQGRPCRVCLFEAKARVFKNCIESMKDCKISGVLTDTIAEMENKKYVKKTKDADELMRKIKELASQYFILEGRTKKCVMTIQSYGESLLESVEEFREDQDWKSLLWEMENLDSVKEKLGNVTDMHCDIKGQASIIKKSSEKLHTSVANKLKKRINQPESFFEDPALAEVREKGQMAASLYLVQETFDFIDDYEMSMIASVPLKFIGGGLGALAGASTSRASQPSNDAEAPPVQEDSIKMSETMYLIFKRIVSLNCGGKFEKLAKRFLDIGIKMETVGERLEEITLSLMIIDKKFDLSKKAEEKLLFKIDQKKDQTMVTNQVSKIEITAQGLIEGCNNYLGLVGRNVNPHTPQLRGKCFVSHNE